MRHSPANCFRQLLLLSMLLALPFVAQAQQKKEAPAPEPLEKKKSLTPAPAPKAPPAPKPAPSPEPKDQPASSHLERGGVGTETGGTGGAAGHPATVHTTRPTTPNGHTSAGPHSASRTTPPPIEKDPRAPTGLNLRTANNTAEASRTYANNSPGAIKLANGATKTVHADGSSVEWNRNGKVSAVTTSNGAVARMDAQGRPTAINTGKGTTISRGPRGERRIETTRADHTRLVSNGKRGGYAERLITRGGRQYAQRSYYLNGRSYSRVYASYQYLDRPYYGYIPAFYYDPAFYGWAFGPWPAPVAFAWGWNGSPWYTAYGYYFVPYPAYAAAEFWLADYALAQNLQAGAEEMASANDSQAADPAPAATQQDQDQASPMLPSSVKDQVADEVRQIIADEKEAASRPERAGRAPAVPPSLDPRFPLFVVSSDRTLNTENAICSVTAGDILRRTDDAPDAQNTLGVEVVSSKNGDCVAGTASRLSVDDLEEMHDDLREQVDDGLKALSQSQGKGGIPTGPAADPRPVPDGQSDPDPTVGDELKKQQEAADQAEKDIQDASSDQSSSH